MPNWDVNWLNSEDGLLSSAVDILSSEIDVLNSEVDSTLYSTVHIHTCLPRKKTCLTRSRLGRLGSRKRNTQRLNICSTRYGAVLLCLMFRIHTQKDNKHGLYVYVYVVWALWFIAGINCRSPQSSELHC